MTQFAKVPTSLNVLLVVSMVWLTITSWTLSTALAADPKTDSRSFQRDIAPILCTKCLGCHSGSEPKGGLDLQSRMGLIKGGDSGSVIEPSGAGTGLLVEYIEQGKMPPKKPLANPDVQLLKKWIDEGAQWDESIKFDPFQFSSEQRAGLDWWSLQPIRRPRLPIDTLDSWSSSPIDRFVFEQLNARALAPSPPASRYLLARRLWFDLLGVPPSPEEVEAFISDDSPDAYQRLVDRLLASPAYGEHWTRHWLDIAHFGESDGFEFDKLRPHAWPYRDWVIDALNRDLPYDEFARLQIAGDLLDDETHSVPATGFLVGGPHDSLKPAVESMRMLMRQDELEDLTATVGQTFLGLTVQCARCHDHKFDPIRQTDYYRFAATLSGVHRGNRSVADATIVQRLQEEMTDLLSQLDKLERPERTAVLAARGSDLIQGQSRQLVFNCDFRDPSVVDSLDLTLSGGAAIGKNGLVLDGEAGFAATPPLGIPIRAKTLEAWVSLANLNQRGGGVVSLQTLDGAVFNAIVFGEQSAKQWMPGSDGYKRTQPLGGPDEELRNQTIHVAITYEEDGQVTFYRNGQVHGQSYKTSIAIFEPGKSQIVFGLRHTPIAKGKLLNGTIQRARLHGRALTALEIEESSNNDGQFVADDEIRRSLSTEQLQQRSALLATIRDVRERLHRERDKQAFAITPQTAPVVHLLERGSPLLPRDAVNPGALSALESITERFELPQDSDDSARRLGLAQWIASKQNPLFSRTIVNRLWQYHFGQGLVLTPNDLGFSGGEPSHRELLEWLASELVDNDFSLKSIHRLMLNSEVYRQSSQANQLAQATDSDNLLLWRKSPQRLSAEAIRDAMLTIAGQLNRVGGGPGYQDFRPFLRGGTQFFERLDPETADAQRRTVFRTWARGGTSPLLDVFDCPDPSTLTPRRNSTNTPLQALAMLNNSFSMRMAESFAERLDQESAGNQDRAIQRGHQLTYSRQPEPAEMQLSRDFIDHNGLPAWCRVLLNSNEFLYVR